MSQTPPPTRPATRDPNAGARALPFFFAPADPTTMAFLRIVVGVLIVYTHLAYSFDLSNFFGKDAWYSHDLIERERKELPHFVAPAGWEDPYEPMRTAQTPEAPYRRRAVMAYAREHLGPAATPGELDAKLAYLERLQAAELDQIRRRVGDGYLTYRGIAYVQQLSADPADRAKQLAVLRDERLRAEMAKSKTPELTIPLTPDAVNGMSAADRALLARDAEVYYHTLPTDFDQRAMVLSHLGEMDYGQRQAWLAFLKRLVKLEYAEREKQLDYFEFWNVDPAIVLRAGSPVFSIWFHVTDPAEMRVAHCAMLVVFAMFAAGLFTRVTSVLTWLGLLCYVHRCSQVLFGMDTMMNIVMIYLMISDCGATLSVDRLLNRYRAARRSLRLTGTLDAATLAYLHAPPLSVATGFAQRLLQMHFCVIYLASGMSKLKGAAWWNTTAYWDTLVNPEFTLIYYHWYENALRYVVSSRPVFSVLAAGGVAFTFVIELGFPFLIWTRLRPWLIMGAAALHFGIGAFMGLIVFSLFMMAMLLCYLPGAAIRERLFGQPNATRRTLHFPAGPEHHHRAALIAASDFSDALAASPGGTAFELRENGATVATSNRGWQLLLAALTSLPRRVGLMAK